ncbi:MAG: hypothetical protein ACP5UO_06390 [Thermoplasmata archaeon]
MPEGTDLLYLEGIEGSYIREVDVKILGYEDGGYILDRSVMHYQGGGQPGDHGFILSGGERIPIYNVVKKGRKVLHLSRVRSSVKEGRLVIDWERRYSVMRMHTLQHAISAVIFREGVESLVTEVFPGYGYIVANKPAPLPREIYEISSNPRGVRRYFLKKEELDRNILARCNLEKLPKSVNRVSIVEIEGLDACTCAGTHVKSTGEIGEYWVRNPGNRLEFGLF